MDKVSNPLESCDLFQDLPPSIVTALVLPQSTLQFFPKGCYLLQPQQRLDSFALVVQGTIHTQHIALDGSYRILDVLAPGDILGLDLLFTRTRLSPYHAVTAAACQLLYLPVDLILSPNLLPPEHRMAVMHRLLTQISQENMRKEYRLAILSQKGLRERITTYLTMQASRQGTNTVTIPFSREEMASYLCVNRSALSHELSLMQNQGLLTFRKNTFTLHTLSRT